MRAIEVISSLQQRGVTLRVIDGSLKIGGVKNLSEREKSALRAHKPAILRALAQPATSPDREPVAPSAPCPTCGSRHYWLSAAGWQCWGCTEPEPNATTLCLPVPPDNPVWQQVRPPLRHGRLQDVPEIPKSGEPRQVEAWTPSGNPLLVTAYSEEHAEAIQRMNPPKFGATDRREAYEERAAIMEHDGGLTMREAEQKAGTCYYCRRWRGTRSGKGYCCINLEPPVARNANESCERFEEVRP